MFLHLCVWVHVFGVWVNLYFCVDWVHILVFLGSSRRVCGFHLFGFVGSYIRVLGCMHSGRLGSTMIVCGFNY